VAAPAPNIEENPMPARLPFRRATLLAAALALPALAQAATLRIAAYNVEADIDGYTAPRPGMAAVLKGIGEEALAGHAQPLDILALEETTSNSATVAPIVADLNTLYGGTRYRASPYQATQDGGNADGNGPNALVYNGSTLKLLASTGVGTPQGAGNGEYRQTVRYTFQPASGSAKDVFYIYVSHYKSGTTAADESARAKEARLVRADAKTLPAGASVLYLGDLNLTASSESAYAALAAAGAGQANDPLDQPGDWDGNDSFRGILTENATDLRYRDDFELATANVLDGSGSLRYVAGTYHALGNDGSTPIEGSVGASANTALPGLADRTTVLKALTTASDHLPVVADYTLR
jgi:endonuclease/exonuclease/phosphatase family metal-dependent hydrolase